MGNVAMERGNPNTTQVNFLEDIQREATLNPLSASALLECVDSAGKEDAENTEETKDGKGREQHMRLEIRIPLALQHLLPTARRSHVIVVADNSGSMCGNPWNQIKSALTNIVKTSLEVDSIIVDVIVYAKTASVLSFTAQNYESVIGGLHTSDVTSFVAAFRKIMDVINTRSRETFDSTMILFMTDGTDTVSSKAVVDQELVKLKTKLQSINHDVVLHTVGFTKGHNLEFLQQLCGTGTSEGLFRYCEPDDGPDALQEKVEELFEFAVFSTTLSVDVEIMMDGENKLVGMGKLQQSNTFQGEITKPSTGEHADENESAIVLAKVEAWVFLTDAAAFPSPTITVSKKIRQNGVATEVSLPCKLMSIKRRLLTDDTEKAMWGLNILSRNTDILAAKVAQVVEANKDITSVQTRLHRLQDRVSKTRLFGQGISKEMRGSMCNVLKEIQARIDQMHSMLARVSRGETSSVSILARAHDLRFEAQFSKSRRQRIMDKRAVKNIQQAKQDQVKLLDLTVSEAELRQLSQEAVDFFFCTLSQDSILDILQNADNKENAIGFGLAIKRPEFVVDDPTSVRLCLISGTLVSRTSMLDALEFKINLSGHLQAHNGFEFYGNSLGYATVGAGREPINAWLPLYITKTHWERVKVLLKPSLGYLCTLDPLGFDWRQLDIMFMVLGAMIGQLSVATVGLHQLRLLFTFQRTCAACIEDFNLTDQLTKTVREFLREPKGRLKNVIPNLYTLIGYMAALPTSVTRPMLGYTDDSDQHGFPVQLWYSVLAETLRRGGSVCFKSHSDHDLNAITDLLLHGRSNNLMNSDSSERKAQEVTTSSTASKANATSSTAATTEASASAQSASAAAHFTVLCNTMATKESSDLKVQETDSPESKKDKVEVELPVELKHSQKMDQAMEIWAQAECGIIKNKNQADKVTAAKKHVKQFIKEGREMAGLSDPDTENGTDSSSAVKQPTFDIDAVDSSVFEITAKLLTMLSRSCFPELSSMPGAIAFLHTWLSGQHTFTEMTCGLPPDEWIQSVKKAVMDFFGKMDTYVHQCTEQVSDDHIDQEELVVVEDHAETTVTGGQRHRQKNQTTAQADEDSETEEFEDHEFLQEDDPLKIMKRRQQEHQRLVTLPMILHALDPCQNQLRLTRGMLCQAVQYCTNSRAREACTGGKMLDLKNKDAVDQLLVDFHDQLVDMYKDRAAYHLLWKRANFYLLHAKTVCAFVGYLMNTYADRQEGVSQLLDEIFERGPGSEIPCLVEKIQVLLSGRWQNHVVFARGNACIPGKDLAKKLEKVLGQEAWTQIEMELRGTLQIHVYRESDIPNRHGHCNSNPYIPPALRLKLGMNL